AGHELHRARGSSSRGQARPRPGPARFVARSGASGNRRWRACAASGRWLRRRRGRTPTGGTGCCRRVPRAGPQGESRSARDNPCVTPLPAGAGAADAMQSCLQPIARHKQDTAAALSNGTRGGVCADKQGELTRRGKSTRRRVPLIVSSGRRAAPTRESPDMVPMRWCLARWSGRPSSKL
ncbi:hypothetical protein TPAR_06227, partial [Tolypocladium paradoxum]